MEKFKRLTGEDRLLIIGIPILVVLTVGGWLIWHATAELDDIEERTLQISSVLTMTREHLVLVVISALLVIATAVPLGIVLTRKSTKFMAPIITSIANIGQAAPVVGDHQLHAVVTEIGGIAERRLGVLRVDGRRRQSDQDAVTLRAGHPGDPSSS